ncbi:MAG: hypothetical protein ACXACG_12645 [Candidatus Thorarchaeota archaeon]|jgi:hypothetical protein
MSQDIGNRRRIIGTVAAVSLFIAWIVIDLYVFPLIGIATNYPLYELVTYGSWAVIALVCFLLLSWAGWFPMRQHEITSDSTISEA